MTSRVFVKPVDEKKILMPENGAPLPRLGAYVDLNFFWRRRIEDNDVTLIDQIIDGENYECFV